MSSVSSKTNTRKLKVYIGKYIMPTLIYSKEMVKRKKVLVFDLDETLGCFGELFEIWSLLFPSSAPNTLATAHATSSVAIQTLKNEVFLHLVDLYPEFFRPHIFQVLKYIYSKIISGECECVYLYTNNQCTHPEWVELLMYYVTTKIAHPNAQPPLFARPICAFKINDKIVEHNRTTHAKTYDDFIACTLLPRNIEICYVDDKFYSKMVHDKVYYIQPPPYYHNLPHQSIFDRFIRSDVFTIMQTHHITKSPQYPFGKREIDISRVLTATENQHIYTKMMYYLKEFFMLTTRRPRTRKQTPLRARFTKRRRHPEHGII